MKKNFLRNILLLAGSLLTVALAGCGEGENTYEYRVQNQTQKVICIDYELHDSPKIEYDTLQPGENALIYTREEVSGDGIWDIESGSVLFAIRKLKVSINDSIYTENLCTRKIWQGPQEEDGVGIYCMPVVDSLFVLYKKWYRYELNNNTSKDVFFVLHKEEENETDSVSVQAGESLLLDTKSNVARYLADLYAEGHKIGNVGISDFRVQTDTGLALVNNYNANDIANWTFLRELVENDTIGRYVLNLEESVFDNMQ